MPDMNSLEMIARDCGFTHCVPVNAADLRLHEEVRAMCEANTCHQYGRTWFCPPGLGTMEECAGRISRFARGILVQTVGQLEDPFDYDSMVLTQKKHQAAFDLMREKISDLYPHLLPIGAGACTRCETCTYPDAPCRHPGQAYGSMEGYGMLVHEVCKSSGLAYYYGENTLAFTSCFLLE